MYAIKEAGEESNDPVFAKICADAATECEAYYKILTEEFLKEGTEYRYGEHEIIVSHGLELEKDAATEKRLDENRSLKVQIAKIHDVYIEVNPKKSLANS